jgi:predicted MFS family arabinose efflux permease
MTIVRLVSGWGGILATSAPVVTFRSRPYRYLWSASLLWNNARWADMVVLGWLVLEVTNSAWHVAVVGVLRSLPMMLFGLFGGVIADRFDRRALLIGSQVIGATVTTSMAALVFTGSFRFEHAIASSLLLGMQWAVEWPTRRALIPELVGRELTSNAIALESVSMNLSKIVGPLAAGWLIAYSGPASAFLAVTVLALLEIVLLALMPLPARGARPVVAGSMVRYLRQGWEELRLSQPIVGVLLITVFMNMLAFPHQTLLPVFARDVLFVDAVGLGMLGAASGVGSLLGALVLAGRAGVPRPGWLFAGGSFAMCLCLVGFALTREFPLALLLLGLSGLGQASFSALQSTIILAGSSDQLRGRAMGALTVAIGTAPLGLLEIGAITAAFGAPIAVATNAAACAVLVAWVAARLPGFRRLSSG